MAGRWSGLVLVLIATTAAADPKIRAEIAAVNGEAAAHYDRGIAATDAGNVDEASAAFTHAIAIAPDVDHLHRALCGAQAMASRFDDAITQCEHAIRLAPDSPLNVPALVDVLLARGQPKDRGRAFGLAEIHAKAHPKHPAALSAWCRAIAELKDRERLSHAEQRGRDRRARQCHEHSPRSARRALPRPRHLHVRRHDARPAPRNPRVRVRPRETP
jgi:predicted Zn-dependent protease